MDLLAPGGKIISLGLGTDPGDPGTYYATMSGTSMATPFLTGAGILVGQALNDFMGVTSASKDYILQFLVDAADDVVDEAGSPDNDNVTNTGLTFKRLDLYGAVREVLDHADLTDDLADGQAVVNGSLGRRFSTSAPRRRRMTSSAIARTTRASWACGRRTPRRST